MHNYAGGHTSPSGCIPRSYGVVSWAHFLWFRPTTTNGTGNYTIPYLISGQYTLTVQKPGFQTLVRQGIKLETGDYVSLNLALKLGTVSQTITVTNAAPLVNTATATSGTTLSAVDLAQMPLEFGNPIMLSILAAGAQINDSDGLGMRGGAGQLWQEQDPSIVNGRLQANSLIERGLEAGSKIWIL